MVLVLLLIGRKSGASFFNPIVWRSDVKPIIFRHLIDHFTVVYLVTWPLNDSEARGDLVLIKTSLPLLCKSSCSYAKSVSKQGHCQSRCHSKIRSPSRQL